MTFVFKTGNDCTTPDGKMTMLDNLPGLGNSRPGQIYAGISRYSDRDNADSCHIADDCLVRDRPKQY